MDNFKDGIVLQIQLNERDLSKYEIDLDKENITGGEETLIKDEISKRKYCIKVLRALLED
tara:strand:- start:336 stop:515 length:180 start_codon:yes stop_codon:yes gene_type:complete